MALQAVEGKERQRVGAVRRVGESEVVGVSAEGDVVGRQLTGTVGASEQLSLVEPTRAPFSGTIAYSHPLIQICDMFASSDPLPRYPVPLTLSFALLDRLLRALNSLTV